MVNYQPYWQNKRYWIFFGLYLRKTLRPSSTATIMVAKLSSARTMSSSIETSVPVIPYRYRCPAVLSDVVHRYLSPVMATTPFICQAFTIRTLCSGDTRCLKNIAWRLLRFFVREVRSTQPLWRHGLLSFSRWFQTFSNRLCCILVVPWSPSDGYLLSRPATRTATKLLDAQGQSCRPNQKIRSTQQFQIPRSEFHCLSYKPIIQDTKGLFVSLCW